MVSLFPPGPFLFRKSIIGRFSIKEWTLYGVWRSFPISKVDPWLILLRGKEGFGGFEADRFWDRISIRIDVIFNSTNNRGGLSAAIRDSFRRG